MFDKIDAAYFLVRAKEERLRAATEDSELHAERHRRLAEMFDEKSRQLRGLVETD